MRRLFLDANVLFAAAYSNAGASRALLMMALGGSATLVVSRFVIEEARRNLAEKAPAAVPALQTLVAVLDPEIVPEPTAAEVRAAAVYTASKDAPVVAAAVRARVDFLVTMDKKHLLDPPEVAERSGLRIVPPPTALEIVRGEAAGN